MQALTTLADRARYRAWMAGALVCYATLDLADWVRGRREPMVPPRAMAFRYGIATRALWFDVGRAFLHYFVDLGGLQPDERVLEIGCGVGRMAVPLAGYLSEQGSYEGVDIVPSAVRWCARSITPRHPNFTFRLLDVYNKMYNPGGQGAAAGVRLPYPDARFDFIFLTSVFTHLLPPTWNGTWPRSAACCAPAGAA